MKLYRDNRIWSVMIGRLSVTVCWETALALVVSIAPASRPWWSIRDGYVFTKGAP